jgi:hypothetical protein
MVLGGVGDYYTNGIARDASQIFARRYPKLRAVADGLGNNFIEVLRMTACVTDIKELGLFYIPESGRLVIDNLFLFAKFTGLYRRGGKEWDEAFLRVREAFVAQFMDKLEGVSIPRPDFSIEIPLFKIVKDLDIPLSVVKVVVISLPGCSLRRYASKLREAMLVVSDPLEEALAVFDAQDQTFRDGVLARRSNLISQIRRLAK